MLDRTRSALLVIDVQEGYRGHTVDHERMVRAVRMLVDAATLLEVPVLATEQYPKGIGHLQPEVAEGLPSATEIIEKMSMSCCGQPRFVAALEGLARSQIVVCGIEAHACVNQTVHDLLAHGYQVHVPLDAISARRELDRARAGRRSSGPVRCRRPWRWSASNGCGRRSRRSSKPSTSSSSSGVAPGLARSARVGEGAHGCSDPTMTPPSRAS